MAKKARKTKTSRVGSKKFIEALARDGEVVVKTQDWINYWVTEAKQRKPLLEAIENLKIDVEQWKGNHRVSQTQLVDKARELECMTTLGVLLLLPWAQSFGPRELYRYISEIALAVGVTVPQDACAKLRGETLRAMADIVIDDKRGTHGVHEAWVKKALLLIES